MNWRLPHCVFGFWWDLVGDCGDLIAVVHAKALPTQDLATHGNVDLYVSRTFHLHLSLILSSSK